MTLPNVMSNCFQVLNFRLSLATLLCLILCAHQGFSTVVPIGSCILIYSESCPRSEIQFYLFTRNNPNSSELVYFSDVYDNVTSSSFNSSLPNKIIVHGYNADMNLDILQNIKTAYLQRGDYNVWFVNWPDLCRNPCYVISVYNLDQVGKCVAQMINRLKKYTGQDEPDVHLIGFSLGAHVAAYSSKHLRPYKLPRITGLDPAMPMFSSRDRNSRLDTEDAKFVDVIHTSAFVQGQYSRSGHVDFYMNGGIEQPGCWNSTNMFDCNHRRAPQYFAESINSVDGFWGWPCTGILNYILDMCPMKQPIKLMGEHCAESSRGFYIVPTKSSTPFAKGPLKIPERPKTSSPGSSSGNSITTASSRDKKPKSGKANETRTGKSKKIPETQEKGSKASKDTDASTNDIVLNDASPANEESTNANEITTLQDTTDDEFEIITGSTESDSESEDIRFVSNDTEIDFSDDVTTDAAVSTAPRSSDSSTTTTEKSKYRFIYKVPRPKKDAGSR